MRLKVFKDSDVTKIFEKHMGPVDVVPDILQPPALSKAIVINSDDGAASEEK